MGISTHILDITIGMPADGVEVNLYRSVGGVWRHLGRGTTNADGRVGDLLGEAPDPGHYSIDFAIGEYFDRHGVEAFYPRVDIEFLVHDPPRAHYHVPLLLSPYGYSTYRGS